VCIYVYIYTHTHTHTLSPTNDVKVSQGKSKKEITIKQSNITLVFVWNFVTKSLSISMSDLITYAVQSQP